MMTFTEDEMNLMMLYNPGSREGLIRELQVMQSFLTGGDRNLRKWTISAVAKLEEISDAEYEELPLVPDFVME